MSNLKEVILMEGEQILFNLEGDAFNVDPNPISKLIGKVTKILGKFIGISKKVYILKTSHRLLRVEKDVIFWKIQRSTVVKTLTFAAIDAVGYEQKKAWLVFKSLFFVLEYRSGNADFIKYNGTLEELNAATHSMNETLYDKCDSVSHAA